MTRADELRKLAMVLRRITLAYDELTIRDDLVRIAKRCEELAEKAERETYSSRS
jgi:hypothetical protein